MTSGCGDVLSLADLQTAKKHQIFEAEVITGKAGGVAGGADIDTATNQVTGQLQKTMPAILRDLGFVIADFNFNTGGTLATGDENKVVLWPGPAGDGQYYSWHGVYPKIIPAGSTPETAGGVSDTAWKLIDGIALRVELTTNNGAGIIQYRYKDLATSTKRTVGNKLDEQVNLLDFHCDGTGASITPGVSVDSRPYIQAAIDHLSAAGGGVLRIPMINGAWYLGSFGSGGIAGHSGIIQLKSNVNLQIEGKIQLGSFFDGKAFQVFVGFDNASPSASGNLNNCHIFGGGIIDFGGATMPSGGALRSGITFGKSYNCSLRDITLQNGDMTWGVTLGWNGYGSDTVIENIRFYNLILTANNQDHSTVYVNAPYSGVHRCLFFSNNARARDIACTVELHQHDTWYTDSSVEGYVRGCYVTMHAAESEGAGAYTYNVIVDNIRGTISGQFVIFTTDKNGSVQGVINGAMVSNCVISGMDGFNNLSFIEFAPGAYGVRGDVKASRILIANNNFYSPSASSLSTALNVDSNIDGIVFDGNLFNTRYGINCRGAAIGTVNCSNLIWKDTNVIGPVHNGQRASANLFDMQTASFTSSSISVKLTSEDTSMYSVILFPAVCSVTFSNICVSAEYTGNMANTVVFEGNQQTGANVYVKYPITISYSSDATLGAVAFYSDASNLGWVSFAYPLTTGGAPEYNIPPSWTAKSTGRLWGLGYNTVAAARAGTLRMMVSRKI